MPSRNEPPATPSIEISAGEQLAKRLDSWKQIASYLNCSDKTARRWERNEGLPVHRLPHEKRSSVYAYSVELEAWWESRKLRFNAGSEMAAQHTLEPSLDERHDSVDSHEKTPALSSRSLLHSVGRLSWVWLLLGVAGLLSASYSWNNTFYKKESPLPAVSPLTSFPGSEVQPSLSPDGNQVAFAFKSDQSANYHVFVKPIGSERVIGLTSAPADDLAPSWSHGGERIAFLRFVSDRNASVMLVPAVGGSERLLATIAIGSPNPKSEIRLSWSRDGNWIATSDALTPLSPMRLILISVNSGEKKTLDYQPAAVAGDLSPSFSPDGQYLTFARHLSPDIADIYVVRLPGREVVNPVAVRLTSWNRMSRDPVWTGDGQNILFVGDDARLGQRIWKIAAFSPSQARPLSHVGEGSSSIAICPQKNRLVYSKEFVDANIWRIDLKRSPSLGPHQGPLQVPLVNSTKIEENPQYSTDGTQIAFQSNRSGDPEIWVANNDGSEARQLTHLHARGSGYPRWSPDGREIVFHARPNGYANIFVVDVKSGDYHQLTSGTTNDTAPSWSRDGKSIYFCSDRKDGPQIWKMPARGGPPSRITSNGGLIALESAEGDQLFFSKLTEPGLWFVPRGGGMESQILPSLYGPDTFAVAKTGIYFARHTDESEASISFMGFSPRITREITSLKSPVGMGLAVSHDQQSLLYTAIDQTNNDLILVDNFD